MQIKITVKNNDGMKVEKKVKEIEKEQLLDVLKISSEELARTIR